MFGRNPEVTEMNRREEKSVNAKVVQAELKAMYESKAARVGMALDVYCARFKVTKTWESK